MSCKTKITHEGDMWTIATDPVDVSSCLMCPSIRSGFGRPETAAEVIGRLQMELMNAREKINNLKDILKEMGLDSK